MQQGSKPSAKPASGGLNFLTPSQVRMIDDLLVSVGDFGRVQLTVKNGKLRYAERIESIDTLKYEGSS